MARILHLKRPVRRLSLIPRTEVSILAARAGKPAARDEVGVTRNTGTYNRSELVEDLVCAVMPEAAPTVLAIFGFKNLKQYLDGKLESDGDALLGNIAERIAGAVGREAVLYEPRRGEFCVLFSGDLPNSQPLIRRAAASTDKKTKALGITTVVGFVELPAEADTAGSALHLANARQSEISPHLRPARRPSVTARVSNALGRPDELRKSA
jgi:GGDEF domain-containing protein